MFVATSYFPDIPRRGAAARGEPAHSRPRRSSRQTYPSGATREQAFGYHLFVLQLFLAAGMAGRRSGKDFPTGFWLRLERMFAYAGALAAGGPPPFYGDADDGYVLDLGDAAGRYREPDAGRRGAVRLGRPPRPGAAPSEAVHWLFGTTRSRAGSRRRPSAADEEIESVAFADAGYYLLQWGGRQARRIASAWSSIAASSVSARSRRTATPMR